MKRVKHIFFDGIGILWLMTMLVVMLSLTSGYAQVVINDSHSDHNQVYFSCDYIVSPGTGNTVLIEGSSEVVYASQEKIILRPGFSVKNLTGNGFFKATVVESQFPVMHLTDDTISDVVGQYEKLELGLTLPEQINALVDSFFLDPPDTVFNDYTGLNPFNPEDISIEAVFRSVDYPGIPAKKVFGFYFKDYNYINITPENTYWIEDSTDHNWRIRFAPDQLGEWQASVVVRFPNHPALDSLIHPCYIFECQPSENPGYIIQNENNTRMLKFSGSGEQFFGVGLNIAWPDKFLGASIGYYNVIHPKRFIEYRDYFREMSNANGNFVRIMSTPFDFSYEWETLNHYDSKFEIDTIPWGSKQFTDFDQVGRMALAFEMDSLIDLCEDLGIYVIYCHEFHFQYATSHPVPGGGFSDYPYIWPNNPYKQLPDVDSASDFLTKESARKYFAHKLRYSLARWGYSTSILGHEFINEIDQINCIGSNENDSLKGWQYCPYKDNSPAGVQFREDLYGWHEHMMNFVRNEDNMNYQQQLFSASYGSIPAETDEILYLMDFTNWHPYASLQDKNEQRYSTYKNYFASKPVLWEKPFYLGEMGLSGNTLEGCSSVGIYACDELSFHNDSWATASFSGMSIGMHWWWDKGILDHGQYVLNHMKLFFDEVDLLNNNLFYVGSHLDNAKSIAGLEYYYTHTLDKDLIYGWVHNYDVYWTNYLTQNQDCLLDEMVGWEASCIPQFITEVDSVFAEITFENIPDGQIYILNIFNTRTGEFQQPVNLISMNNELTVSFGYLGNDPEDTDTPPDYAFILVRE